MDDPWRDPIQILALAVGAIVMHVSRLSSGVLITILLSSSTAVPGPWRTAEQLMTGKTTRRLFDYVGLLLSKATQ
jgi:hypothetical protein